MGVNDGVRIWSVSNGIVECEVYCTDGAILWSLRSIGDRPGVLVGPSALPAVVLDGDPLRAIGGVSARLTSDGERVQTLCVSTRTSAPGISEQWFFQVFPDQPFVRLWGKIQNDAAVSCRVTNSEILRLDVTAAQVLTLFHVEQFSWVYRRDFFSQNQVWLRPGCPPTEICMGSFPSRTWAPTSCAWLALGAGVGYQDEETPREGPGLVVGIEFNGKSRVCAWADSDVAHIRSTIDGLNHRVDPDDAFDIPACFVGLFHGDWDEAGYTTQRFAEGYVHPPMPDDRYPWIQYNTWGYGQDIDEAQQLRAVELCAEMGVEVVVLDLGWAAQIGEWRADPVKFPRGLAPLADRVHELGMKFGVHIPLAQANVNSPVVKEHPDWLAQSEGDYFGAAPICLGHAPCRGWLIGEIVQMIDDYHIDYIVQDGEDMVKPCSKTSHTHEPGDSNYSNSTQGLDAVVETVRRLRPDVVWENCEDGGCMLTYKMARNYHSTITVDNIATYATRQGVYGASYPFSPRYSVRYMQDDPTSYTLRSAMFGGPLILMQRVTEWDGRQIAATRAAIGEYKDLRALIRDAKVIHLLAPRYNVEGVGWGWDGIQAVSPDRARSVAMVYRAMGDGEHKTIRPRGLKPDAVYSVQLVDGGTRLEMRGDALAGEGIELALDEFSSEIIRLDLV